MKKKLLSVLLACNLAVSAMSSVTASARESEDVDVITVAEVKEIYLSDIEWESENSERPGDLPNGTVKDAAVNGDSIRLIVNGKEQTFDKGLGTHAPSQIVYNIEGKNCTKFEAYAGVDLQTLMDYNNNNEEGVIANFVVEADGIVLAQSGEMNPSKDAYHFEVDIPAGAKKLTLKAESGVEVWSDWADWADAKIVADYTEPEAPDGPTIAPVEGNHIRVSMEKGVLKLYRGDILIASSLSLGKVAVDGKTFSDFQVASYEIQHAVDTDWGEAERLLLEMYSESSGIRKTLWIDVLKDFDGAIVTTTFLESGKEMKITEVTENEFSLSDPDAGRIWSYNGGGEGTQSFYDTLQKVYNGFYRENRQDETAAAIPAADIYSVNGGVTVADGALYRRFLTTPVRGGNNTASVSIHWKNQELAANTKTEVGTAVISVHDGDYYNGLRTYAEVMEAQGFSAIDNIPESSYELRWESWGWEGAWTIDKIIGKLDSLYEQGIRQITLDDCWYTSPGDWGLNPQKFPNGVSDMQRLTKAVHDRGMTIILWWRPMDGGRDTSFSVISGFTQQKSKLLEEHPEYFVKNEDGSFAKLSGPGSRDSFNGSTGYALCPQSEGAIENQKAFIRKAMTEWGIDGFKSDYVWGMPKCYNEEHHHSSPEESTETASGIFYKEIYEEMISINPDAFHLLCNCGTPQDYYSLPYVTQIPTADPTSVDQTRRRVKAYKALAGDDFPVTTDHNEIWYPSTVGTGAVLIEKRDFAAGSAQETEYYKWLNIARTHELYKGTHIGGLYAYGVDPYETYVIEKDGIMYYSFYRDGKYKPDGNPEITLKGLDPDTAYRIEDYVNDKVLAEQVSGSEASLSVNFSEYLLIRAVREEREADILGLKAAIKEAEIVAQVKTTESAAGLNAAIAEAKKLLDEGTAEEVDEMISRLNEEKNSDKLIDRGNTDDLSELIASFRFLNKEDYTAASWAVYQSKLMEAKAVVSDNSNASQADVDLLKDALRDAKNALEQKGQEKPPVDPSITLPYEDVKEDDWFYDVVYDVYVKKLMTGLKETVFGPGGNLARAQFAMILYRMEGSPEMKYVDKFPDVGNGQWYTNAILWAAEAGVVTGYTDTGKFGPSDNINREQMAVMMYRYAKYKKYNVSEEKSLSEFPDGESVSQYALDAMMWCTGMGIISGDGKTHELKPQHYTIRAEAAAIISRYVDAYQ